MIIFSKHINELEASFREINGNQPFCMGKYAITFILSIIFSIGVTYTQVSELPYYSIDETCSLDSSQIIANSLNEIKGLSDCNFLNFDFSRYTIIGIKGSSPGHFIPDIDFRISKNLINKTIIVEVLFSGGKTCNCRVVKPLFKRIIYVDKIEVGYKFEFKYVNIDN